MFQRSRPTGCLQGFIVLYVSALTAYWVSTRVHCIVCFSAHGLLGVYKGSLYVSALTAHWVSTRVHCMFQRSRPTGCLQGFIVLYVSALTAYWVSTRVHCIVCFSAHGPLGVYKGSLYCMFQRSRPTGCLQGFIVLYVSALTAYWVSTRVHCIVCFSAHGPLGVYKGSLYCMLQRSRPTGCLQGFIVLYVAALTAHWVSTRVHCIVCFSAHGPLGVYKGSLYCMFQRAQPTGCLKGSLYCMFQRSQPTGCLQGFIVLYVSALTAHWVSTRVHCIVCFSAHGPLGVYKGSLYCMFQRSRPTGCLQGFIVLYVSAPTAYWVSTRVHCIVCFSAHGPLGVYKGSLYCMFQCPRPTGCLQGFIVLYVSALTAHWVSTRVHCIVCFSAHGLLGVYKGSLYCMFQRSRPTGCLQGFIVLYVSALTAHWVSTRVHCIVCFSAHGPLGVYKGSLYCMFQRSRPTGCLQGFIVLYVSALTAHWVSTRVHCIVCFSAHGPLGVYKGSLYCMFQRSRPTGCIQGIIVLYVSALTAHWVSTRVHCIVCFSAHGPLGVYKGSLYCMFQRSRPIGCLQGIIVLYVSALTAHCSAHGPLGVFKGSLYCMFQRSRPTGYLQGFIVLYVSALTAHWVSTRVHCIVCFSTHGPLGVYKGSLYCMFQRSRPTGCLQGSRGEVDTNDSDGRSHVPYI